MSRAATAVSMCEVPCQDLKALKTEVRQNRIHHDRDFMRLQREAEEREERSNEKLDAVLTEIQGLRQFIEDWIKGGKAKR